MLIQVDIAAGGWHSTALTKEGEVSILFFICSPAFASGCDGDRRGRRETVYISSLNS